MENRMLANIIAPFGAIIFFIGIMVWCHQALNGMFGDPDNWMHLAFIEQSLTDYQKGFIDPSHPHGNSLLSYLTNYWYRRDNAGMNGMELIWTLPYTIFTIICMLPFLILGYTPHASLDAVDLFIGPLGFALCSMALWYCATAFVNRDNRLRIVIWIVPFMFTVLIIMGYSLPGRMSHHPLTYASCIMLFGSLMHFYRTLKCRYAIMTGIFMSLSLWCSMETLPFCLLQFFLIWAMCIYRGCNGVLMNRVDSGIKYMFSSAFVIALIALLIDPPVQGIMQPRTDRYSIIQFSTVMLAFAFAFISRFISRSLLFKNRKLVSLYGVSVAFIVVWGIFMVCNAPLPANMSNHYVNLYFWKQDGENLSIIQSPTAYYMDIFPIIPANIFVFWMLWKHRKLPSFQFWMVMASVFLGGDFIALCSLRLGGYVGFMSILVIVFALRAFMKRKDRKTGRQYTGDIMMSYVMIICGLTFVFLKPHPQFSKEQPQKNQCMIDYESGAIMRHIFGNNHNVMTDIWDAPSIIWHTYDSHDKDDNNGLNTVSGPYHPNMDGLIDEAFFWSAPLTPDNVIRMKEIIHKRHLVGGISCVTAASSSPMVFDKDSLQSKLFRGQYPDWIVMQDYKGSGQYKLFKFKDN